MIRKRKQIAEINVVPYIDVMLVLLIIFMVTAPLLTQGVQISLPKVNSKVIPASPVEPLVVSLDNKGLIYLDIDILCIYYERSLNLKTMPNYMITLYSIKFKGTQECRNIGNHPL